jgi:hypothetical protein
MLWQVMSSSSFPSQLVVKRVNFCKFAAILPIDLNNANYSYLELLINIKEIKIPLY